MENIEKKLLFEEKLLSLYAFSIPGKKTYEIPIVLVPPLMISNTIFNLMPSHSMVKTLLEAGFKVYLIDFGKPDKSDSHIDLGIYILDMLYRAVFMTKKHSGAEKVSLIGFCLGGTFSLAYASASIDIRNDVKNIIAIASPVDFNKLNFYKKLIKPFKKTFNFIVEKIGYLPKSLITILFKIANPLSPFKRYFKLLSKSKDKELIERYKALSNFYNSFTNLPSSAFIQMCDFIEANSLMAGNKLLMKVAFDFANFNANLLTIGGSKDTFIPMDSVTAIHKCIGSSDAKHIEVPLGHMTILGSLRAKNTTWKHCIDFLQERSGSVSQSNEENKNKKNDQLLVLD